MIETVPTDVILDIGLPEKWTVFNAKMEKNGKKEAILILTARSNWTERVEGLNAGADDYLPHSFEFDELKARLGAIIRRKDSRTTDQIVSTIQSQRHPNAYHARPERVQTDTESAFMFPPFTGPGVFRTNWLKPSTT